MRSMRPTQYTSLRLGFNRITTWVRKRWMRTRRGVTYRPNLWPKSRLWIRLKLPQESHVIFDEMPDVIDGVFPHGDPLDAKAERPA